MLENERIIVDRGGIDPGIAARFLCRKSNQCC